MPTPAHKLWLPCPIVIRAIIHSIKAIRLLDGLAVLLIISLSVFVAPQVEAANKKPGVNIAKIAAVSEGDSVNLDGSASTDKDGTISSFVWVQTKGATVNLNGANSAIARFTAPVITKTQKPTKPITLSFKLTVTDNLGATRSKMVNVSVKPVNALPVANAGSDMTVALNAPVDVNAAGSSDDGQIVRYEWKQINATKANRVKLTGAKTLQAGFTSPNKVATLEFQLKVTDNDKKTAVDTIKVTVGNPNNNSLYATFNTDKTTLNQGGSLLASVESISGGTAPYSVTFDWGDGTTADQSTLETGVTTKSASHSYAAAGSYTLTSTVTDGNGGSKTNTQLISVTAPALSAQFTLNNTVILEGDTVLASATNISGGSPAYQVKFEWGGGAAAEELSVANGGNSQSATHVYAVAGEYPLTITVTDSNHTTKSFTVNVRVEVADPLGEC